MSFSNMKDLQNFLLKEEILYIEIRSISYKHTKSIVFSKIFVDKLINENSSYYQLDYLNKLISTYLKSFGQDLRILLSNIDFNNYFIEVFLAHKTLVFFCETLQVDEMLPGDETKYLYGFFIDEDINQKVELASPADNNYRDFLGEIVSSLIEIGEHVSCFFIHNSCYTIVLNSYNKYSREKVNYSTQMVARAYNIPINRTDRNLDN